MYVFRTNRHGQPYKPRKKAMLLGAAVALTYIATSVIFAQTARAADGPTLEITDFIGTINWVETAGKLNLSNQDNMKGVNTMTQNGGLRIDGGQEKIDGKDCKNVYGSWSWNDKKSKRFGGYESLKDYPVLSISVPADTRLILDNVVVFTEGSANFSTADIEMDHCGKLNLGDVAGRMTLSSRGSADVVAGNLGELAAELRGSGDVTAGNVGETVIVSTGSGNIDLDNLASLELTSRGSGDVDIGDIDGAVSIEITGSGDVEIESLKSAFQLDSRGSSDVEVGAVTADVVEIDVRGSGDVDIDEGVISRLTVASRGSSDVDIDAEVADANLSATGSGDIYVSQVTGTVESRESGSGDIDIGSRN